MQKTEYRGGHLVIVDPHPKWQKVLAAVLLLAVVGVILAFCFLATESRADTIVQGIDSSTGSGKAISGIRITPSPGANPLEALLVTGPVSLIPTPTPAVVPTVSQNRVDVTGVSTVIVPADSTFFFAGLWLMNAGSNTVFLHADGVATVNDMPLLPNEKVIFDVALGARRGWRGITAGTTERVNWIRIPNP